MTKTEMNLKFRIIYNDEVEGKFDLLVDDGYRNFILDTCLTRNAAFRAKSLAERTAVLCGRTVIA